MRLILRATLQFVVLVESLAVAERDDEGVFGLTEGNEHGNLQRAAIDGDFDERRLAVLSFTVRRAERARVFEGDHLIVNAELLGGLGRDERGIVPGEFGNRIG